MGANADAIRGMYDSFAVGDVASVLEAMDPEIQWYEAESFPYADGNPYVGPDSIVSGVFSRLANDWESWSIALDDLLEAERDVVLAVGRYAGKYKRTGASFEAKFAHIWWLRKGKAVKFQQFTDTAKVRDVMASQ